MKILTVDIERCYGCRGCEMACAFRHGGDFHREDANIRVNMLPQHRFISTATCTQCERPRCKEACPAGAIRRNRKTGAVEIDYALCRGCRACVMACPSGNIYFLSGRRMVQKCDLCQGEPACVRACLTGALDYCEPEEIPARKRAACDERLMRRRSAAAAGSEAR